MYACKYKGGSVHRWTIEIVEPPILVRVGTPKTMDSSCLEMRDSIISQQPPPPPPPYYVACMYVSMSSMHV